MENLKIHLGKNKHLLSHTEFYKKLHLMEDSIIRYIYSSCGFVFDTTETFKRGRKTFTTKYKFLLERDNWDLIIINEDSPDERIKKLIKEYRSISSFMYRDGYPFFVEYKSNIEEWGKQVDDFMRQINKRRRGLIEPMFVFLMTFDERFEEWREALKRADINLIILPKELST